MHIKLDLLFSYIQLKDLEEEHPQHENLYPINSKHFTESSLTSKCTLNKFREEKELKKNDLIFLEYKYKPKRVKVRDVILRYKVSCIVDYIQNR